MHKEIQLTTPNKKVGSVIIPKGIVLHDTEWFDLDGVIEIFQSEDTLASAHLLIDLDGTRYVFGEDYEKLYHAGYSIFKGRKWCNNFMLGVEFLGHTEQKPLTEDQINSFREWVSSRFLDYDLEVSDITTHKKIRTDYINEFGDKDGIIKAKRDISDIEFKKVIDSLFV